MINRALTAFPCEEMKRYVSTEIKNTQYKFFTGFLIGILGIFMVVLGVLLAFVGAGSCSLFSVLSVLGLTLFIVGIVSNVRSYRRRTRIEKFSSVLSKVDDAYQKLTEEIFETEKKIRILSYNSREFAEIASNKFRKKVETLKETLIKIQDKIGETVSTGVVFERGFLTEDLLNEQERVQTENSRISRCLDLIRTSADLLLLSQTFYQNAKIPFEDTTSPDGCFYNFLIKVLRVTPDICAEKYDFESYQTVIADLEREWNGLLSATESLKRFKGFFKECENKFVSFRKKLTAMSIEVDDKLILKEKERFLREVVKVDDDFKRLFKQQFDELESFEILGSLEGSGFEDIGREFSEFRDMIMSESARLLDFKNLLTQQKTAADRVLDLTLQLEDAVTMASHLNRSDLVDIIVDLHNKNQNTFNQYNRPMLDTVMSALSGAVTDIIKTRELPDASQRIGESSESLTEIFERTSQYIPLVEDILDRVRSSVVRYNEVCRMGASLDMFDTDDTDVDSFADVRAVRFFFEDHENQKSAEYTEAIQEFRRSHSGFGIVFEERMPLLIDEVRIFLNKINSLKRVLPFLKRKTALEKEARKSREHVIVEWKKLKAEFESINPTEDERRRFFDTKGIDFSCLSTWIESAEPFLKKYLELREHLLEDLNFYELVCTADYLLKMGISLFQKRSESRSDLCKDHTECKDFLEEQKRVLKDLNGRQEEKIAAYLERLIKDFEVNLGLYEEKFEKWMEED